MNHAELAAALRQTALLEGDFTLRSGRKSRYYLDKYLFETQPELLRPIAERVAERISAEVDRIAGPELGAVALAAAVSLHSGKPFVIVRNSKKADYGTGKLIEGRLAAGDRVVMVEDIVTSGGQAIEAARVLTSAGATVTRIVVIVDRLEGGMQRIREAGFECESLFTSHDLGIFPGT